MKKNEIKTKRLIIQPMSDEEIETLMEHVDSDELHSAYGEMLNGCRRDPENRVWYAPWKMILKESQTHIGEIGFKGVVRDHTVEIGYGILPEYEGNGYTSEALLAITQWAFGKTEIVFIKAETESENKASQRVLEKCGFTPDGEGEEGPRFVLESPLMNWSMIYMCFGMSIGMALGTLRDQMVLGMSIGMSIGICIGMLITESAKKEREKLRQKRKQEG